MINAILGIICIGAIAAFLVMWSKWEKEKEKRWDEISRAAGLENIIEDRTKDVLWYEEQLANAKQEAEGLRMGVDYLGHREDVLQDKLSSVFCPTNNHVWKDGVCVKCGRVKNG